MNMRNRVFVSYSHVDAEHLRRLRIHLAPYIREKKVDMWDDTRLMPGSRWKQEIQQAIGLARVAIILVSADFLASEFIAQIELPLLLEAAKQQGILILPVILSPCAFTESKLATHQSLNDLSSPLLKMSPSDQEAVWARLAKSVTDALAPGRVNDVPFGLDSPEPSAAETTQDQEEGSDRPVRQGILRRTVLLGLAGLVAVAVSGIGLLMARLSQNLPAGPSTPARTSSGTMFGYDLQRTHFHPKEQVLSHTAVRHLVPYWTATTGDQIRYSSPVVAGGIVYVGSEDHTFSAFDAATGTVRWAAITGGSIRSSPAVAGSTVYVGSEDGSLYAFDATTGHRLWNATTGGAVGSSPAVAGGVVYAGSGDYKLYALDATSGSKLWAVPTGYWITSSPAVANGVVYVGSWDYKLYALDATTGKILWTAATSDQIRYSSPAVAGDIVYIGSKDFKLYAFDATTGHIRWTATTGGSLGDSSPAVANGVVYIGSEDAKLYAFDAITGHSLWTATTGAGISSPPAVANGVVYVGSWDSRFYAFDATTGHNLWTATMGDQIRSSPAVANGVVYIGSWDHKLYAFHVPDTHS
jgi:outer membrane protein assembly factor BamB